MVCINGSGYDVQEYVVYKAVRKNRSTLILYTNKGRKEVALRKPGENVVVFRTKDGKKVRFNTNKSG